MEDVTMPEAARRLESLSEQTRQYLAQSPARQSYFNYWFKGFSRTRLRELTAALEQTVDYLSNSTDKLVINKLSDYPVLRSLWLYHPTGLRWMAWTAVLLFPVGIPVWLVGIYQQKELRAELQKILRVSAELEVLTGVKPQEQN